MRRTLLAAALGLAILVFARSARCAESTQDPLLGLWGTQIVFTSALHGDLAVTETARTWKAVLSGKEAEFPVTGDRVQFSFPDALGSFRGHFAEDRRAIEGFWVQPPGASDPRDPLGSNQAFASPLVLTRRAPDTWHATVVPLPSTFTLYLKIFRDADGSLSAAFRNPEINSRGGASQFHVTHNADAVAFSAQAQGQPEIRIDAKLERRPDRIRISWPDIGRVVELERLDASLAAAFYPRPPGKTSYAYRMPPEIGDGWQTARAADMGMDEAALEALVQRFVDGDPAARRPALLHSLLVAYRGKLILEEYFFGHDRTEPHDLRSAGKTFASVMLGAAMMAGLHISPETHVYDLLSGMGPFENPDPRKAQITMAQLLTHTSGLACDDNDDGSPGNEDTMQSQNRQPNWWKYTLDLPVVHDPGSRYAYCSAGTNLVGATLTTASGLWLPEFFNSAVARPLQWGRYYWNLMPSGEGYLGGGSRVLPRDLLKLGQVYLDGGVWHGRRIVDASWVVRSTAPKIAISRATTGQTPEQFSNFYVEGADGYAWHLSSLHEGERSYREYAATGNGGQVLSVVPDLDLAVVYTAGNYTQGGIWGRFKDQILIQGLIPAMRRP